MYVSQSPRLPSAIASAAMLAGIAAMVVYGLAGASGRSDLSDPLAIVALAFRDPPPPPPEPRVPQRQRDRSAPKEAPSPRNLRNHATPVTAPIITPLILPPPIVAAPKPGPGDASNNGASDRIGSGQGAGGLGDGPGGGGDGDGDGGGDYTAPRQIGGDLRMSDLPGSLLPEGGMARVEARYAVYPDGRVGECRIIASSGIAQLDAIACRSIVERFRYRPSRDDRGRPVRAIVEQRFSWRIDGALERSSRKSGGD